MKIEKTHNKMRKLKKLTHDNNLIFFIFDEIKILYCI